MITDSINEALKRGANADDIISELERQNPDKSPIFQEARNRGASSYNILQEIQKQNPGTLSEDNPEQNDTFLQGHSVIRGISDILGTTGLAKGTLQAIFLNFTPEGKGIKKMLQEGKITPDEFNRIVGGGLVTPKEVLGSAIQTGVTIGTAGIGPAKAATRLGRVAETGLKFGGLSAISGGAKAFGENKSIGDITKETALSGAVGGAFGVAAQGISEVANMLTKALPKRIIRTNLPTNKDITDKVLNNTKLGSVEKMLQDSRMNVQELGNQINSILKSPTYKGQTIATNDLFRNVAISFGQSGGGGTITGPEVKKLIIRLAPDARGLVSRESLNLFDANRLRILVDKRLGQSFFAASSIGKSPTFVKDVAGAFNGFLRNTIKSTAKETVPVFGELSKEITLRNGLKALNNKVGAKIGLLDILSVIGGGVAGGPIGGAVGIAAERAARTPAINIGVAKGLNKLGQLGKSTLVKTATGVAKTFVPGLAAETTQ